MILQNVSYKYIFKKVLDDISFTVPKGQIIGIIGENGCGKSTLLRLMAGVLTPTEGNITFEGQTLNRRMAKIISFQSDIDLFYEHYKGKDLFTFYNEQFNDFSIEKAYEIASFLNANIDEKLKNLSKGNRAKVKITVALARNAKLYLFDEPFSGLDPLARQELMKALIHFIDLERCSVVLSTHEVSEIEQMLDQLILLKDGKLHAMEHLENIRDERGEDAVQWMKSLYEMKVK